MKTTKELFASVLDVMLNEKYFSEYKYRKSDKTFIKKRVDGFDAIEFQVHDYYDLKRDRRAMQITPLYTVRFDVLHKWFEKYSFKAISDQKNNYLVIFGGKDFNKQREYYFLLDEKEYKNDLEQFLSDVLSNAKQFFNQFTTLESVYNYIIPPILSGEKELPDGQADWIFEYLTLCRIVAPKNYDKLKAMILERIEFILSRPIKDINIMYYYPNLDAILKDMESQF